ncbi:MAG TPA: NADP-dependent oxidoreductase [Phenylobacterium sp.]|uniref:NADP-dependent oxidoreductase n=1 Tax=Phenylobacterium sp. TaxID=1871053 RepID=UPI002B45D661|nr:NADP-dependent oxidoreductase [Phenylobacterium sp.]HKR89519.1 NADP-dependent oxidoreductase [Phenylobacterium sp.]
MKAVRIHQFGGPETLQVEDLPMPQPGQGEVRIRVMAASVNPVDYKVRNGGYLPREALPLTLGRDVAGVIDAEGPGVEGLLVGEAVYAMLDRDHGGYVEYVTQPAACCAPKPAKLDFVQAAAVPLAGLTAWQGLFDHGGLESGQRVLIHGAAGGVGHFAVQFARVRGATVIATCSGRDADFVESLGASEVIDYHEERFEDRVQDVDLVFDLIGGETQERSWAVLKTGGIMVSTLKEPDQKKAEARYARGVHYMAHPDGQELAEIARLIDAGQMVPRIDRVYPLDAAAEAEAALENDHVRGKIVLEVAAPL